MARCLGKRISEAAILVWSVGGLVCSAYTMIEYPYFLEGRTVRNRLVFWLFQVGYLFSFIGLLFQTVLLILTILLICAVYKNKPRCFMPWIVWMIIMLCGVIFQTFWAWNTDIDVGTFVACISLPFCAVMTYFLLVIISFYQSLTEQRASQRIRGEEIECDSETDQGEAPGTSQQRGLSPNASQPEKTTASGEHRPEPEAHKEHGPEPAVHE